MGVSMCPYSSSGTSAAVGMQVVEEGGGERVAVVVVGHLLVQRPADALGTPPAIWPSTTMGLIMTPQSSLTMIPLQRDCPGLRVDLARADVVGVGPRERGGRLVAGGRLEARLRCRAAGRPD